MSSTSETSLALARVADLAGSGQLDEARKAVQQGLPFIPRRRAAKRMTERQVTAIMIRDGFIDRYTGLPVWHPGALKLLSELIPDLLPWHPHGRLDECHEIFWDLSPSIDHVEPLTRGGDDRLENWVTTSWGKNTQKSNMSLAQLGWTLHPAGRLDEWDGYLGWFIGQMEAPSPLVTSSYLKRWYRAAIAHLGAEGIGLHQLSSWAAQR